jgi:hypothetical protein
MKTNVKLAASFTQMPSVWGLFSSKCPPAGPLLGAIFFKMPSGGPLLGASFLKIPPREGVYFGKNVPRLFRPKVFSCAMATFAVALKPK